MDKYYQILGLNPGASEEEIKEAYRDLVNVWHPDRFSNNPRLRYKANQRMKEINMAYEKLKSCFTGETSTASEGNSHDRSQPPPHDSPPRSEEEQQSKTNDNSFAGSSGSQPPPKGPSGRTKPHDAERIYAGFWNRFAALIIDSLIMAAGSTVLSLPFLIATGLSENSSSLIWGLVDFILFVLIGWLYYALLESSSEQATLGKRAVGIVVTDINGNRISFGRASGRWLGKTISSLILGIGYVMAGFTRKKQALHDIMANTLVLERPEGARSWLTGTIVVGQVVILLVFILFLTLYRQPTRTIDYTETAPAPSPPLSREQATPTPPPTALPAALLPQEIEKLKDVLENIRQANLRKNIDLLMSCYASDYKDLEERRRTALQSWSKYNYLDLDYVLKVESVSIDSAKARVEWWIRSIPVTGGQPEEGKSALNAFFQKEKNEWKIKDVAPIR